MTNEPHTVSGTLLDEEIRFTLVEFCRTGRVTAEVIIEMVQEGILEPQGVDVRGWSFDATALKRLQTALRLQRDLRVNLAGAALALDLLDELSELRRQMKKLNPTQGESP